MDRKKEIGVDSIASEIEGERERKRERERVMDRSQGGRRERQCVVSVLQSWGVSQ